MLELAYRFRTTAFVTLLLASSSFFASAQGNTRAARLSSVQGTVTLGSNDTSPSPAQINAPLPAGIQVSTGVDGQAEIEFEDGSVARLTPNSSLSLDRLEIAPGDIFTTDVTLQNGVAYFELRATQDYVYTVRAGDDLLSPVQNSTVRVSMDTPPASFAVFAGEIQVRRPNQFQINLQQGEAVRATDNGSSPYALSEQIAQDSWDQWNSDMDQQASAAAATSTTVRDNYAGAQGYGWGDMDDDGTWYDVQGTGSVWQPYLAQDADFDPYGNGAWVWYPGGGYMWASAYPWGWTPFRCGDWSFYDGFGWGWAPDASCGAYGWGFGGGHVVNIRHYPRGYRPLRPPVVRPGPVHPVMPVHVFTRTEPRLPRDGAGPKMIAGAPARPVTTLRGVASVPVRGPLQRDFPIDRTTHAPAFGYTTGRPQNVYRAGGEGGGPQHAQPGAGSPQPSAQQGSRGRGMNQGSTPGTFQNPAPQQTSGKPSQAPQQPQGQVPPSPVQTFGPPVRNQHVPAQPPVFTPSQPNHPAPPSQPLHQNSPAPQAPQNMPVRPQQQNFTPPPRPSPPPQQPHFSAPPPQHFSPPPPPPPPQPHVSAPPPSSNNGGHR